MIATHLLVGNPTAQSGKNAERIDRALALPREAGVSAELLPTLPGGKTTEAVRSRLDAGGVRAVIAMGGDGTFREVASGLLMSHVKDDVPLGMLPTGTANDQGKSFGLEASPEALSANVAAITRGHETRLDAGLIRGGELTEYFFDSAGWGLSARVLGAEERGPAFRRSRRTARSADRRRGMAPASQGAHRGDPASAASHRPLMRPLRTGASRSSTDRRTYRSRRCRRRT